MKAMPRLISVLLLCLNTAALLYGQESFRYSDEAERLWRRGLEQYREGSSLAAVETFDRALKILPMHQRTTAVGIMRAKALYELGENIEVSRSLRSFLVSYPWSTYVPDAQYLLGLTYLRIRRFDDAMDSFIAAWTALPPPDTSRLHRSIVSAVTHLTTSPLSAHDIRKTLEKSTDKRVKQFLWLRLAEKEVGSGNVTSAGIAVDSLDLLYQGHPYTGRVAEVRRQVSQRSSVKVGALLPLMGSSEPSGAKEIGNDVYKGIQIAFEEHKADPARRVRVELETMDTDRDPATASRLAREMTANVDIIGIIGPVFSSTTSAVADLANSHRIPLVTPTANSNGLAATGEYVFQANPDFESRGRAMARFAVITQGFQRLAVLAPSDAPGRLLAEAFMSEALSLGGRIVATEWYQKGTTDLSQQLTNIRHASMREVVEPMISFGGRLNQGDLVRLIQAGASRKTLDSLIERSSVVPASFLLGPNARRIIDSLQINVLASEPRVDSLQHPATGIEGIYIPISGPGEIGVVSSQLVYFNIKTQILGSGEWDDIAELDAHKRYCAGVIFDSDTYANDSVPGYREFRTRFMERFQQQPGKNSLYGYDTARLILTLIANGASTRERLRTALAEVSSYQGLHSRIGFFHGRVNSWLWIQQYERDSIRMIAEINTAQSGRE